MLISPLVAAGTVFQEPRGPAASSQFELTSVPATIKNLFNLTSFLTKRDAWAGSFDELLLDQPRMDTPVHLPDAPKPSSPWIPAPPTDAQRQTSGANFDGHRRRTEATTAQEAKHCVPGWDHGSEPTCLGVEELPFAMHMRNGRRV